MEKLIESLLAENDKEGNGNAGIAVMNLSLRNGMQTGGALKRAEIGEPGLYKIGTAAPVQEDPGAPPEIIMVEVFFRGEDVMSLARPMPQSTIVMPDKKILM